MSRWTGYMLSERRQWLIKTLAACGVSESRASKMLAEYVEAQQNAVGEEAFDAGVKAGIKHAEQQNKVLRFGGAPPARPENPYRELA